MPRAVECLFEINCYTIRAWRAVLLFSLEVIEYFTCDVFGQFILVPLLVLESRFRNSELIML